MLKRLQQTKPNKYLLRLKTLEVFGSLPTKPPNTNILSKLKSIVNFFCNNTIHSVESVLKKPKAKGKLNAFLQLPNKKIFAIISDKALLKTHLGEDHQNILADCPFGTIKQWGLYLIARKVDNGLTKGFLLNNVLYDELEGLSFEMIEKLFSQFTKDEVEKILSLDEESEIKELLSWCTRSQIKKLLSLLKESEIKKLLSSCKGFEIQKLLSSCKGSQIKKLLSSCKGAEIQKLLSSCKGAEIQKLLSSCKGAEIQKLLSSCKGAEIQKLLSSCSGSQIKRFLSLCSGRQIKRFLSSCTRSKIKEILSSFEGAEIKKFINSLVVSDNLYGDCKKHSVNGKKWIRR